jgi:hypothetical protein
MPVNDPDFLPSEGPSRDATAADIFGESSFVLDYNILTEISEPP